MPFNGSGIYNPVNSPDFPAVTGQTIRSAQYNNEINDIATALSNCITRDGQSTVTSNLNIGGFRLTNIAPATNGTDAINLNQLAAAFPVGAIYLTAGATNPGTWLAGTTWTQIAAGRFLIGVGTLAPNTYTAGATGGEASHTLTANEMPWHNHTGATGGISNDHTHSGTTAAAGGHGHTFTGTISEAGGLQGGTGNWTLQAGGAALGINAVGDHVHSFVTGGVSATHNHGITAEGAGWAHENRPPYLAVYIWQRTA